MNTRRVQIPSISCAHCIKTIKRELGELEGVELVEGDGETKTITVTWHSPTTWENISDTLREAGYEPDP